MTTKIIDSPTRRLAEFACNLTFEELPDAVIQKLKLHILDALGAALYASTMPWCRMVREVLAREGGKKEATVWGTPLRLPVQAAAMANSMATHGFELDDRRVAAHLHPASGTVPPSLAMAEREGGVSGKAFLTAVAAGYEVSCRVGKCTGRPLFARGLYPPGFSGAFAATTSTGKLLGLDPEAMARAFHLTATQACGLYSPTHVKRFNIGVGTRAGVLAAFLAKEGYEGVQDIFEAQEGGYCRAFADKYDLSFLTENLSSEFEISKVELKPYVSSRPNHTAIDAALELAARYPEITPESIDRIEIKVGTDNYRYGAGYAVNTVSRALMSVAYCAAVAIVDGDAFLDQFTIQKVQDPRVQKLLERSVVSVDPEVDRMGLEKRDRTTLTIVLKDGSRYETTKDFAKGHPSNPMSREEVLKKFRTLGGKVLDEKRLEKIIKSIDTIEGMEDVARIGRLMATRS
jgi:aconitate decarboxylase